MQRMMKIKLHTLLIVSTILAAGFLSSCVKDPIPVQAHSNELMLSPALLDLKDGNIQTRAMSEDDLKDDQFNENKVSRLDVFIFKADGTFVKDYHIGGLTPSMIVQRGGKEGYLLSNDWKNDGLNKDVEYKVFVVANSTNEAITTEGATTTIEGLKALSTTDENIYKQYKEGVEDTDVTYTPNKTFLMNATVDSWTIPNMSTQLISDATVTLQRAAVKYVLDVTLSEKFKQRLIDDNVEYGNPKWKFVNFNTVTPELPEGTTPIDKLVTRGSGDYLTAVPGEEGHFIVNTYAYPHSWTAANSNDYAPALLLSYQVLDKNTGNTNYHYYYIPLCANTITSTERNKLYKVNAVISSYGSFETLTSTAVNLTYEVKDWVGNAANVNAYAMDYLLVTPSRYSFKGGNTTEALSKAFQYYASGSVTITDKKAYYTNKNGQTTTVTSGFSIGNPSNGKINVTSTVPTNGTFRTIEFIVHCGDKSQKVIIRHYPADYVTAIPGKWSSYNFTGWAENGVSGKTYNSSYVDNGSFRFRATEDDTFNAHVYYNGQVYELNTNGNRGSSVGGSTNNQMYVLQITSANDQYRLGRPELTEQTATVYNSRGTNLGTVKYYTSNDDVLSPAFMLGSQLGVNYGFSSQATSAIHCALYKEVAEDGTVYTGWRLPTKKEVEYMIYNQTHNTQVMIVVLGGRYYWTLDGGRAEYPGGTSENQTFTRCVRDLTAEEIEKLNQF